MELYFAFSSNTQPYINLAAEWELFENNNGDAVCLFLWQNYNTVVIGANQNPYSECNLENIEKDNVKIARRRTGGGAVFHDLGNLNFSFITSKENYDVIKQLSVVQKALSSFGITCGLSGRNDILCEGRKFSGNAFYTSEKNCLHHGTLLINADFSKMKNYLSVNSEKLMKKGVSSVESRVINLSEICPGITVENIIAPLKAAFESVYGQKSKRLDIDINKQRITRLAAAWQEEAYIFGKWKDFKSLIKGSFDWGLVEIELCFSNGGIAAVKIASDSLYPDSVISAEKHLTGKSITDINNTATNDTVERDIINLIRGKLCTI